MASRAHVIISGRVQGVFYRQSAKNMAKSLGVTGWIRNLPDGRVEGVFEGESYALAEMVRWCRSGPEEARVDDVDVVWDEKPDGFRDFNIRY